MPSFKKLLLHIQKGTLGARLSPPIKKYFRDQRKKYWARKTSRRSEFVFPIFPKVRIVLYSDCELSKDIFLKDFEIDEITFMAKYLQKRDVFIDIGSNFGYYSLIASSCVGPLGKVYAIEPTHKTFMRLLRNIELNRFENIIPIKKAISSQNGKLPMNISQDGYDAWNSLTKPDKTGLFVTEEVEAITLDDLTKDLDLSKKISMIKIDVEGWEIELLKGGQKFLSLPNAPVFQVEFNDRALSTAGYSSKILFEEINKLGFELFHYDRKKNQLTKFPYAGERLFINLYAIKPSHLNDLKNCFVLEPQKV